LGFSKRIFIEGGPPVSQKPPARAGLRFEVQQIDKSLTSWTFLARQPLRTPARVLK
jgi:hypothetical protein